MGNEFNSIVGDDGVIIVDPGVAPPLAMPVVEAFQEITDKPVKAIIYTHGHLDHLGGSAVFYKPDEAGGGFEANDMKCRPFAPQTPASPDYVSVHLR